MRKLFNYSDSCNVHVKYFDISIFHSTLAHFAPSLVNILEKVHSESSFQQRHENSSAWNIGPRMKNSIIAVWKRASAPKSRKTIVASRRPQLTRASQSPAVRIIATADSNARSNCKEQRVAIKCGRGEISRSIDYWSSFELRSEALQKKREANGKNSLCIRSSENTAKTQEEERKGKGKERENASKERKRESLRSTCARCSMKSAIR